MTPPSHPDLPRYLWREYDSREPHPEEEVHLPHKGPVGPRRMVAWVHEPEEECSLAWLAVTVPGYERGMGKVSLRSYLKQYAAAMAGV